MWCGAVWCAVGASYNRCGCECQRACARIGSDLYGDVEETGGLCSCADFCFGGGGVFFVTVNFRAGLAARSETHAVYKVFCVFFLLFTVDTSSCFTQ